MKLKTCVYNVGYPIYGARFIENNVLLVAGGGGEGNNGIPNKLTALQIDFKKKKVIKRFREITFDETDDSPTTLDVANNIILIGCNENSSKIKNGDGNMHLRKFIYKNNHLKFDGSVDLDRSNNPEHYTKLTYMSHDGAVAAISSSKVPTTIRIVNPSSLRETYEIETGSDVKDLHFSLDGKVLSYITASSLEVISIVTGNFIVRKTDFDKNYVLSKVRFISEDVVLIASTLKNIPGVLLIKISLKSGTISVLKTKLITNKFKGVTSMDVNAKGELVGLSGNDNSIVIVRLTDFKVITILKKVHTFAVTRISFSPDSKYLASVSAANTIHIIKIPEDFATGSSIWEKLLRLFISFISIVLLAIIVQESYKYDIHNKLYQIFYKKFNENNDTSSYFVLNDWLPQTTLVGHSTHSQNINIPHSSFDILSTKSSNTFKPMDLSTDEITPVYISRELLVTHTNTNSLDTESLSDTMVSATINPVDSLSENLLDVYKDKFTDQYEESSHFSLIENAYITQQDEYIKLNKIETTVFEKTDLTYYSSYNHPEISNNKNTPVHTDNFNTLSEIISHKTHEHDDLDIPSPNKPQITISIVSEQQNLDFSAEKYINDDSIEEFNDQMTKIMEDNHELLIDSCNNLSDIECVTNVSSSTEQLDFERSESIISKDLIYQSKISTTSKTNLLIDSNMDDAIASTSHGSYIHHKVMTYGNTNDLIHDQQNYLEVFDELNSNSPLNTIHTVSDLELKSTRTTYMETFIGIEKYPTDNPLNNTLSHEPYKSSYAEKMDINEKLATEPSPVHIEVQISDLSLEIFSTSNSINYETSKASSTDLYHDEISTKLYNHEIKEKAIHFTQNIKNDSNSILSHTKKLSTGTIKYTETMFVTLKEVETVTITSIHETSSQL